jgi:hypothetical protein
MNDFVATVAQRLPLAQATLALLDHVTDDAFLHDLFQRHRQGSYEKVITFPLFVHLIADALLQHDGSGHQSFRRAQEDGALDASFQAMYGKLGRLPIPLSRAFLAQTTARLHELLPPLPARLPTSLQGFTTLALDGKKIKHVAKKLKILRPFKGQLYGGKLVVAQDVTSGLALALDADPDGERSDAPLVPGVLEQVRATTTGPRLWLCDRQYCDLNQPRGLTAPGDHYLIRYNAKVSFHADPQRPAGTGPTTQGPRYRQEWGWLGKATDPRRQYVRRISLSGPDDEALILVTDLLDAALYPAADLLAAYRLRWGIETLFQNVTEVFHLAHLIGSTPRATIFEASFCLLLANLITVVRAYVAAPHGVEPEQVSIDKLFEDVHRQLIAWYEVLTPEQTLRLQLGPRTAAGLRSQLQQWLGDVWSERWRKPPRRSRTPRRPRRRQYLKGGHTSVFRILMEARKKRKIAHCASLM